jgi:hypothetical protein
MEISTIKEFLTFSVTKNNRRNTGHSIMTSDSNIRHIRLNLSQNNSAGTKYAFHRLGFSRMFFSLQSLLTTL